MIIILSAQYVEQDLRAEFGEIPPTFLPVGNKRLYTYQISNIRSENPEEKICMTLPKSYQISSWDKQVLEKENISIIPIDETFSLGQSIAFCLASSCASEDDSVIIYYGDTLLRNPVNLGNIAKNVIYTAHSDFNYVWLKVANGFESNDAVFCGVLSIANPQLLIRNLISTNFDFTKSLLKYNETNKFEQEHRSDWLDFGHLNTFYDSKTIVTTERAFNELKINKYYVEKRSQKKTKLHAEANWFSQVPEEMAYYSPMLISHGEDENGYRYKLEYLYSPTLTELFVFGNHHQAIWEQIINSCFHFIESCHEIRNPEPVGDFYNSLVSKNNSRLDEFIKANPRFGNVVKDAENNSYYLNDVLAEMHQAINTESKSTFIHGDFCFSNILYDFKKNDIKVIDPRGIDFDGKLSIYGDIRYDLAKILHSAIGKYDYIVSDRFNVNDDGETIILELPESSIDLTDLVKKQFETTSFSFKEILALTATLFLSMLPLHYDRPDRQLAFVATAINLYKEFKK
ncbi:phosphotransferase [Cronobacter dublinensis]|uniref:WeoK n=2 Tax=Cronobacter dublinensis TaxID=413497 RepID=M9NHY2_9ENTR|nr:phosphotransferase [Cronobacter dublinensis]CCJ85097.1 capsular polysaccharide biosynthesis protein [Cronobacter dublinensis 582]AFI81961.1 WeoK [Cronobacter dublinensis subsp. lausannensis LMG 23824]ELQ6228335.1 capsular biosynthesis protein [Cronobacter dublinensis]ELY2797875.1 capsular biosynthesis protein [Cronobacter dublinensis]ELY3973288.1 capsular biosynthesis protein [Cronobacter dublinensis]